MVTFSPFDKSEAPEYTTLMPTKKTENETVLYRKYRPASFADVIGQDHIVDVLKMALSQGKISHAYLLTGSRGIGKTTVARIIAAELGASANDTYEIDAASNRGIDNIRELREGVRTMPFDSKYKVYIIDEVHMLTKEAFNALLKTLEEPPAHVVFILATTELEKVPETIVSRCQTFVFKKPTDAILRKLATDTAKKEGFTLEEGCAELIALLGDGSFRDTHGILEKVLSFVQTKKVSVVEVERITGAPSRALVRTYVQSLLAQDADRGLHTLAEANGQNTDMKVFSKLVLELFRTLLILRVAPKMQDEVYPTLSDTDQAFSKEIIETHKERINSKTLARLLESFQMQRSAFIPELPLELALIDIIQGEHSST